MYFSLSMGYWKVRSAFYLKKKKSKTKHEANGLIHHKQEMPCCCTNHRVYLDVPIQMYLNVDLFHLYESDELEN